MQTEKLNWNSLSVEEALKIFEETFKGSIAIPNKQVLMEIRSTTNGVLSSMECISDNKEFESSTYEWEIGAGESIEIEMYTDGDYDISF